MTLSKLVKFLERLGLTEYEAKSLDTLLKLNEAFAPEISRNAQVPKTRVYDVLEKLIQKNLIIEIYGRPKKYKSIEAEKAVQILLEEKKTEVKELENNSLEILKEFSPVQKISSTEKEMKVKNESDFFKILAQEIESAENSVYGFTKASKEELKESLEKAKSKKLEVKLIHKSAISLAKEFEGQGIELMNSDHSLNAYLIDKKKVVLALTDFEKSSPEYHFTVSENKHLSSMLSQYFESQWKNKK